MGVNRVRILNPLPGQEGFMCLASANRCVASGEAEFTSETRKKIRFFSGPKRDASIKAALQRQQAQQGTHVNVHRVMSPDEMTHIPIRMPIKALTIPRKFRKTPRRHGAVRVIETEIPVVNDSLA
jgi:hypothetical protein